LQEGTENEKGFEQRFTACSQARSVRGFPPAPLANLQTTSPLKGYVAGSVMPNTNWRSA
jgi:hypothetical protein